MLVFGDVRTLFQVICRIGVKCFLTNSEKVTTVVECHKEKKEKSLCSYVPLLCVLASFWHLFWHLASFLTASETTRIAGTRVWALTFIEKHAWSRVLQPVSWRQAHKQRSGCSTTQASIARDVKRKPTFSALSIPSRFGSSELVRSVVPTTDWRLI